MILEIAGVSTANKGAELMLRAILEHYAGAADIEFAVTRHFGVYSDRARYGLRTKLDSFRIGRSRLAAALMPESFRDSFGLVNESDISAVIDASGFAFGDQLGAERTQRFARDVTRWKLQGKRVVLLPQAFGPFDNPQLRQSMRQIVLEADRIYARDPESLAHLQKLAGTEHCVRKAPDFTCLVKASLPTDFEPQPRQACIVPNHRMIEKTSVADRNRYIPLLAECMREAERCDLQPYVLLHDSRVDEALVRPLESEFGLKFPVVRESDPSKLKGILGTAHVVIGSRFHALVGALSQAIPSIAIGWSHKYAMLLADYDCRQCLLSPSSGSAGIREVFREVAEDGYRARLIEGLNRTSSSLKEQVIAMWRDVDSVLGDLLTVQGRCEVGR